MVHGQKQDSSFDGHRKLNQPCPVGFSEKATVKTFNEIIENLIKITICTGLFSTLTWI